MCKHGVIVRRNTQRADVTQAFPVLVHPKYLPDNGYLLAIVIWAVMAFHALPKLVKGGFVRVELFSLFLAFLS